MSTDPKIYDAKSFKADEIWSWLKFQNEYDTLRLFGTKEQTERARKRFLNFAGQHRLVLETTRIDDSTMEVAYKGMLSSVENWV